MLRRARLGRREEPFASTYACAHWGKVPGEPYFSGAGSLPENVGPYLRLVNEYIAPTGFARRLPVPARPREYSRSTDWCDNARRTGAAGRCRAEEARAGDAPSAERRQPCAADVIAALIARTPAAGPSG